MNVSAVKRHGGEDSFLGSSLRKSYNRSVTAIAIRTPAPARAPGVMAHHAMTAHAAVTTSHSRWADNCCMPVIPKNNAPMTAGIISRVRLGRFSSADILARLLSVWPEQRRWGKVRIVREPEINLKRSGSSADLQATSATIAGRWASRSVEWW